MAINDSNNDLIADLADEVRGYNKTNNQLLKQLGIGGGGTIIIKQPAIEELDPENTSEVDIIEKINEIIVSDKNAGVRE